MTDQTMIERAARAISDTRHEDYDDALWREMALDCAIAAIEAMREPTPEMVKAGLRCGDTGPEPALGVWRDMIDAALKERQ